VVQAIKGGAAQCWTLDVSRSVYLRQPPAWFQGSYAGQGPGHYHGDRPQYGVPLPGTATNAQLFNAMLQMGMGDLDNSAVLGVIETLAGVVLKPD